MSGSIGLRGGNAKVKEMGGGADREEDVVAVWLLGFVRCERRLGRKKSKPGEGERSGLLLWGKRVSG